MAGHNPQERRLFTDLSDKNRLSGEARRIARRLSRWRDRAASRRGKRWTARYAKSIENAEARLAALQTEILARAEVLKTRIREEQKVSKTEVTKYEKQYKKEIEELKAARQALAEAGKAVAKASSAQSDAEPADAEKAAGVLTAMRRKHWNAANELRRETQDLKKAKKEIDSEAADKAVLSYELRRITAEIEALRS